MRRNDLSNHEQDWQIVDSTPVLMCDGTIGVSFFFV